MKKRLFLRFGIVFFAVLLLANCYIPANTPESAAVSIAAIQGVTIPATEGTPVTVITENEQYSGTVTWNPSHATFAALTAYTATISLTAKSGYTLQGVTANFFTVAGATASNVANSGVITAVFPATGGTVNNPAVINTAAIQGLIIPATGETPVTAITENAQYGGTVTWSPSHATFAASTVYTATIILTAKPGYTLQGVTANFFTVAGATATNVANSGVITVVFPSTGGTLTNPAVINTAAIQGVTVPVTGGTPVTSITENAQYSGTVTWSPNHSTFAASTVYTATITLTAKSGYTLQGVTADFFTVAGATASNAANSGVITAVFPQTAGTTAITVPTVVTHYWVEEGILNLAYSGIGLTLSRAANQSATFAIQGSAAGYSGHRWFVNGDEVTGLANPSTYTFSSTGRQNGRYTVSLFVMKDSRPYNAEIQITVTN